MSAIVDIIAREIMDSRGNPTVECRCVVGKRRDWTRCCAIGRVYRC
jgi:enolase